MAKPVFRWKVSSKATAEHSFDVKTVRFGNGYEQRQARLLKPKMQSWSVQVVGVKRETDEIKAFLDQRRGVESFYWTPPGRPRLLVTVSDKYTETPMGGNVYALSFKFTEVLA